MAVPQVTLSPPNFEMGTPVTITAHRSGGMKIKLHWLFGGASAYILGDASDWSQVDTDSATWTSTVATLAVQVPNAASGIGTVYCDYFASDGTYVGTTGAGFTTTVPASVVPVLGSIDICESTATAGIGTTVGLFVEHLSAPTCQVDTTSAYGSPIVTRRFTVNGIDQWPLEYDDSQFSVDLPALSSADWLTVTATVTDARGRTATATTGTIEVLAYWGPKITDFLVQRCDADGTLNDVGTTAKVTSSGNVPTLVNGTEKNQLTWTVYSRQVGDEIWGDPIEQTTPAGLTWAATDILGIGLYPATDAYEFMLFSQDRFNTAVSIVTITTGVVTMSWARGGVGVSKVWEQGALDVGGQIYQNGLPVIDSSGLDVDVSSLITKPTGSLVTDWHANRAGRVLTLQFKFAFAPTDLAAYADIPALSIPVGLRPVMDAEAPFSHYPNLILKCAFGASGVRLYSLASTTTTLSGTPAATMTWIIA